MSAPAIPAPLERPGTRVGRARVPVRDRADGFIEALFRFHAVATYTFLYLPIVVVVLFSFNGTDRYVTNWQGFSMKWYESALSNSVIQKALFNGFFIAIPNAILATLFGTMAALGLQRVRKKVRMTFDALTYISVIVPEIVIALATLVFFATAFDFLNPVFATLAGEGGRPYKLGFGHYTVIAAHVLFNTSLVLLLVRARLSGMDRTLTEASYDLFASPWRTFRQITFPQLLPAIVAGFLLSFTFSFDDYVITSFTNGPGSTTIPVYVFGEVRKGVTPEINAVASMMLLFTLTLLIVGQVLLTWQARRQGRRARGGAEGMASMITEQQGR